MMMKRGFGGLALLVLIFLIILLFVGIFAGYVLKELYSREAGISGSATCSFIKISPTSCFYVKESDGKYVLKIRAFREGSGDEVRKIQAIFDEGKSSVSSEDVPKALETREILSYNLTSKNYSQVVLVPVIIKGGIEVACSPSKILICN